MARPNFWGKAFALVLWFLALYWLYLLAMHVPQVHQATQDTLHAIKQALNWQ